MLGRVFALGGLLLVSADCEHLRTKYDCREDVDGCYCHPATGVVGMQSTCLRPHRCCVEFSRVSWSVDDPHPVDQGCDCFDPKLNETCDEAIQEGYRERGVKNTPERCPPFF